MPSRETLAIILQIRFKSTPKANDRKILRKNIS
jgi:hypothetical protein